MIKRHGVEVMNARTKNVSIAKRTSAYEFERHFFSAFKKRHAASQYCRGDHESIFINKTKLSKSANNLATSKDYSVFSLPTLPFNNFF